MKIIAHIKPMKWIKILTINITVFLILLCIMLFSSYLLRSTLFTSSKENIITKKIPIYKLDDVPQEFFSKINPELIPYSYSDQDHLFKYPKDYFNDVIPKGQTFNSIVRIKNTELVVYSANYTFDQKYLRHVENQESKTNPARFVINAGCSLTFGEGLSQGFDYPSQLAKKLDKTWKVYNLGFHGNGPNSLINNIQKKMINLNSITENEGVFTWLFMPDHLQRYFCNSTCYNSNNNWILNLTEVKFENGNFIAKDKFMNSQNFFRILMNKLTSLHYFDSNPIPELKYTDSQYSEFAKAIDYIPSQINSKIKKKIFLYFDYTNQTEINPALYNELIMLKYQIIDVRPYFKNIDRKQLFIQGDGHFSAVANWIISDILKKSINDPVFINENN